MSEDGNPALVELLFSGGGTLVIRGTADHVRRLATRRSAETVRNPPLPQLPDGTTVWVNWNLVVAAQDLPSGE